jgi:transposase
MMSYCMFMRNPSLMLTHPEANRQRLLSKIREVPGAAMGIKIAALLLLKEGQRPGWVADVLGIARQSLNLWIHRVNDRGLGALENLKRPGRPARLRARVRKELENHLEKAPSEFGWNRAMWDGPTLVIHMKRYFGITLKVRQAQLWMHQLGYRLKRVGYSYPQSRGEEAKRFRRTLKKPAIS